MRQRFKKLNQYNKENLIKKIEIWEGDKLWVSQSLSNDIQYWPTIS